MKLKKLKQILELYLLNSRAHKNIKKTKTDGFLTDFNLIKTISTFKQALYIIFEYDQARKKILFVGLPKKLEFKINKLTHHAAVDHTFELQNVILNTSMPVNSMEVENRLLTKICTASLIAKLSKKPDLIVFLLHEKKQNIILESNVAKIPAISFSSAARCLNRNKKYNIKNFSQELISASDRNLFFLGLNFLLKRIKKNKYLSNYDT